MKIKDLVAKKWPIIVLLILLVLVFIINFVPNRSLLTNDNYSPELNPILSIQRSIISPAWRSYRGLGVPSDSEQADVFRSIIFAFFNPVFSKELSAQIYLYICLVVGSLSMAGLTKKISKSLNLKVNPKTVFLLGGLFYISTLWVAWVFTFPLMPYISQYAFLPLLLYATYTFILDLSWKNALKLFIASLLISSAFVISTLFIVSIVCILIFLWAALFDVKNFRKNYRASIYALLIIILTQLFWLIPFFTYVTSSSGQVSSSSVNEGITYVTIDAEKKRMTGLNSLVFHTQLLDIYDNDYSQQKMFNDADKYLYTDFYKILGFIPVVSAVLAAVFILFWKKYRLIPFFVLLLVGWFGLKNNNPPFGDIYIWLQDNVQIFRQVFRWPTSKFGTFYVIGLTMFASIGTSYLIKLFVDNSVKLLKYTKPLLISIFFIAQLFYAGFLFNGSFIADRSYSTIPTSYYALADFLSSTPNARIMQFPPPNNGYFREFNYGFYGSGFLHYIVGNPFLEKNLAIGSNASEDAVNSIENAYYSEDYAKLDSDFAKYEVRYLLVDYDQIRGKYGEQIDWNKVNDLTQRYNKVWSDSNLSLFEIPSNPVAKLSPALSEISGESTFQSNSKSGLLSPLRVNATVVERNDSYMTLETDLDLSNSNVSLVQQDWAEFPTTLYFDEGKSIVEAFPAIPVLSQVPVNVPVNRYQVESSQIKYLVVADNVLDFSKLFDSPITIDTKWNSNLKIGLVTKSYIASDYLKDIDTSSVGDCSGNDYQGNEAVKTTQGLIVRTNGGVGCLSTPIVVNSPTIVNFQLKWSSVSDSSAGYCISSGSLNRCLNSQRFFADTGDENLIIQTLPLLLEPSSFYSLNLYAPTITNGQSEVEFKEAIIKKYVVSQYVSPTSATDNYIPEYLYSDASGSATIKIPIIEGINNYKYDLRDNEIWQSSYEDSGITSSGEVNGSNMIANETFMQMYAPLFYIKAKDPLFYYFSGTNLSGYPATICLQHSNSSRCLADMLIDYKKSSDRFGVAYSEDSDSIVTAVMRVQSLSNESINKLDDLFAFEIPDSWLKLAYQVNSVNPLPEVRLSGLTIGNIEYLYRAQLRQSESVFSIPQSSSNSWKAYEVKSISIVNKVPDFLKPWLLPFTKEIKSNTVVNGWRQGWVVDGTDSSSSIYAFYLPNLYSYVGYLVLLATGLYIGYNSIKEIKHGKTQS